MVLDTRINDLFASSIICTTFQDIDPKYSLSDKCSLIKVSKSNTNI